MFKKMWQATKLYRLEKQVKDIQSCYAAMDIKQKQLFATYLNKIGSELKSSYDATTTSEAIEIAKQERQFAQLSLHNPPEALAHGLVATLFESMSVGADGEGVAGRCMFIMQQAAGVLNETASRQEQAVTEMIVQAFDYAKMIERTLKAFDSDTDGQSASAMLEDVNEFWRSELTPIQQARSIITLAQTYTHYRIVAYDGPEEWAFLPSFRSFFDEVAARVLNSTDEGEVVGLLYFVLYLFCVKHVSKSACQECTSVYGKIEAIILRWCEPKAQTV